jgi:hypothetical protein
MTKLTAISQDHHGTLFWQRSLSFEFACRIHAVPVMEAEIVPATQSMPMAFIKQEDKYILVALMSPIAGHNIYVGPNGQWLGSYIPSVFKSHPFRLVGDKEAGHHTLCVDENSGLISESGGEQFFDKNGELSRSVKDILEFLKQVHYSQIRTNQGVNILADAGVIAKWPLKIRTGDGEQTVTGLYRVDETALNALDDETFLGLRKARSLPIAFCQLLSMYNIRMFEKLSNMTEQTREFREEQVQGLFTDDGILKI